MAVNNQWLTPLQRSFDSIKTSILNKVKRDIPEMNDISEGNIFTIIVSIFSAIAEVLHYYIDNMARETFFVTARRFSSLYKHAKLVDYHIMAATPATVDVLLYLEDSNGNIILTGPEVPITINSGVQFQSNDSKNWQMSNTVIWGEQDMVYNKTKYCRVSLWQKRHTGPEVVGTVTTKDQIFYLGDITTGEFYVEGSMTLKVGNEPWALVKTFAYSSPSDKHYLVDIDLTGRPYIQFGDGNHGARPKFGENVYVEYDLTFGDASNIPADSFSVVPQEILEMDNRVKITSPNQAVGGNDYESFNQIKDHLPLTIKTLGVIITKEDYISYIKTIPGIDKVWVYYQCGKKLWIYLLADGGVTTSAQALANKVLEEVDKVKVITTEVLIMWATDAMIYLTLEVTGKKSYRIEDIRDQVMTALTQEYSYQNSDISKTIRLSDMYALVDNLNTVDYLNISNLSILPRPLPLNPSEATPNLLINDFTLNLWLVSGYPPISQDDHTVEETPHQKYHGEYILFKIEVLQGAKTYKLTLLDPMTDAPTSKTTNGTFNVAVPFSFDYSDGTHHMKTDFSIWVSNKGQTEGNTYTIKIYDTLNMQYIESPGATIPVLTSDNIKLTIHETV